MPSRPTLLTVIGVGLADSNEQKGIIEFADGAANTEHVRK